MATATAESTALAILHQVNEIRAQRGLGTLTSDLRLVEAAARHSHSMWSQEFFSHQSPVIGLERPSDRVRAVGGRFDAVGENIAMLDAASASASGFVDGWMKSPGHRENILRPEWDASGVAIYHSPDGPVFATQLFAVIPPVLLDEPKLDARPSTWFVVRTEAEIGPGYELGAFARNRFVTSAEADARGVVRFEVEVPVASGRHHVGFGRRLSGSTDAWISAYEGTAEIRADGSGLWHPGPPPHGGCKVLNEALYRVDGTTLVLELSGTARQPAVVVVDGEQRDEVAAGTPFACRLEFRASSGTHQVHVGRTAGGGQYTVDRAFSLDADSGSLTEEHG